MVKRVCPNCKQATLSNAMYSEDDASVFDQKCNGCGAKHYHYIPSRYQLGCVVDNSREWSEFERKFPKQEV